MCLALDDSAELVDVMPEMTPYSLRGLDVSRAGNMLARRLGRLSCLMWAGVMWPKTLLCKRI